MYLPFYIEELKLLYELHPFLLNESTQIKSSFTIDNKKIDAVTVLSHEHNCLITYSESYKKIIGRGYIPSDSKNDFKIRLEKYFLSLKNRGRPKKDNVPVTCNIPRYLKEYLDEISAYYGMTQGEFIVDCLEFHAAITSDDVMIRGNPETQTTGGD